MSSPAVQLIFLSVALWGTTCMQTIIYFVQYPEDQRVLKALVAWLWLADTVHEILIVKGVYDSQIVDFCDYNRIKTAVPEYLWQILFTSLVAITSQTFFTYRIWRFSDRRLFYWILLVPVCLFELGGGLAFIAFGIMIPTAAELLSPVPSSIFITLQAVTATADLIIAACLVVLLIQSRERLLRSSRSILDKLLILTINTGVWTALFAIFTLVSMLAFKNTLIYAALYFPLCPLYCNTVLANLNVREYLKARSVVLGVSLTDFSAHAEPVFVAHAQDPTQSGGSQLTAHAEMNKPIRSDEEEPSLKPQVTKSDKRRM